MPRDILEHARMFSRAEAEKQINEAIKPIATTISRSTAPIKMMNGDSLQLNPSGLLLNASGSIAVTNIEQRMGHGKLTETIVTYVTYG